MSFLKCLKRREADIYIIYYNFIICISQTLCEMVYDCVSACGIERTIQIRYLLLWNGLGNGMARHGTNEFVCSLHASMQNMCYAIECDYTNLYISTYIECTTTVMMLIIVEMSQRQCASQSSSSHTNDEAERRWWRPRCKNIYSKRNKINEDHIDTHKRTRESR